MHNVCIIILFLLQSVACQNHKVKKSGRQYNIIFIDHNNSRYTSSGEHFHNLYYDQWIIADNQSTDQNYRYLPI